MISGRNYDSSLGPALQCAALAERETSALWLSRPSEPPLLASLKTPLPTLFGKVTLLCDSAKSVLNKLSGPDCKQKHVCSPLGTFVWRLAVVLSTNITVYVCGVSEGQLTQNAVVLKVLTPAV